MFVAKRVLPQAEVVLVVKHADTEQGLQVATLAG